MTLPNKSIGKALQFCSHPDKLQVKLNILMARSGRYYDVQSDAKGKARRHWFIFNFLL
jgi:hypothetical protein